MAALDYDLQIEQGATYRRSIPVLDDAGDPLDVTGWTARGQIRLTYSSAIPVHDLGSHLTIAGTTVELEIPGESSTPWVWRAGVYDIELLDPDDTPTRLLQGRVVVSPEATR